MYFDEMIKWHEYQETHDIYSPCHTRTLTFILIFECGFY